MYWSQKSFEKCLRGLWNQARRYHNQSQPAERLGTVQEFEEALDAVKIGSSVRILLFKNEKFQEVILLLKP